MTTATSPRLSLSERAAAAQLAERERVLADEAEDAAHLYAFQLRGFRVQIERALEIPADELPDDQFHPTIVLERGAATRVPSYRLDGLTFTPRLDFDGEVVGVLLARPCPACDSGWTATPVLSLTDLGDALDVAVTPCASCAPPAPTVDELRPRALRWVRDHAAEALTEALKALTLETVGVGL